MMSRTQISLKTEMVKQARKHAAAQGISMAEYIRRLLARDLQGSRPAVDPSAAFDLGSSGQSEISHHTDAALGEALAADDGRPRAKPATHEKPRRRSRKG